MNKDTNIEAIKHHIWAIQDLYNAINWWFCGGRDSYHINFYDKGIMCTHFSTDEHGLLECEQIAVNVTPQDALIIAHKHHTDKTIESEQTYDREGQV